MSNKTSKEKYHLEKIMEYITTSGVAPAALTVATATAISAADKGSRGWLDRALVIKATPMHYNATTININDKT